MNPIPIETKAAFVNALRSIVAKRCPKNKMGVPLVSDYDLLFATAAERDDAFQKSNHPTVALSGLVGSFTATQLAEYLAREIFKLGDEPCSPCKRIQFKGGQWPDNERNQGGIGEIPLAIALKKMLTDCGVTS